MADIYETLIALSEKINEALDLIPEGLTPTVTKGFQTEVKLQMKPYVDDNEVKFSDIVGGLQAVRTAINDLKNKLHGNSKGTAIHFAPD